MAISWGGYVSYNGYNFFRVGVEESLSSTNTETTITAKTYIQLSSGSHEGFWNFQGRSNAGGGWGGWATGGDTYIQDTTARQISSTTYKKTRTTSAQTVSIQGQAKDTYLGTGTGSASKNVTVPALTSYAVTYNANGGSGAPASQTKYYGVTLTLSSTKPTRTNYTFLGWSTSSTATTATYAAGASYTDNAALELYAVWKLAFVAPTLSKLAAFRSDSSGTSDPSSTSYIHVDVTWSVDTAVTSGNKGKTVAVTIKSGSTQVASGSSTVSTTSGTTSFTLAPTTSGDTFSGAYIVTATITDTNNQTATKTTSVSVVFKPFIMANKGKSAAFFGIADSLDTNLLKIFGRLWIEGRQETWVSGAQGNAAINFYKKVLNANSWNPSLMFQTKGGGAWEVGNHDGEELRFVYFAADRIANSTNTANATIILNSNGTITASKAWAQLASTTGTTKKTFTLPTNCSEILVVCTHTLSGSSTRDYAGSVVVPRVQLTTAETEWYLGGGVTTTNVTNGRQACCKLTTTYITPVSVRVDGSTVSASWTVYWR